MIIFHLITSLDKGGAESHLYSLIKKQVQNKLSVYVFYLRGNDYWKKHLNKMGVKVFKLNVHSNFDFIGLLNAFYSLCVNIKKINPKVVHAHLSTMELLAAFLKLIFNNRFKFIVTKHLDSFFLEASFGRKNIFRGIFIDKFIIYQADKIICISNQVKKYFYEKINDKNKYTTIYYGFSNKDFLNSVNIKNKLKILRKKYNLSENEVVLLNVARHVKQKSLEILLKAFSIYLKKRKNAKLILVGHGRETNNLKKLAIELKINDKICWINNYEKIKDIFLLSNTFVLPSEYEGLGLVLLEAMSSRTPIIASKSSAIPEVIKNNFNGYLFKKNNFKNLAQKLFLIENKKTQEKFKKNGIIFLKEKFSLDKMNKMTTKIYNLPLK